MTIDGYCTIGVDREYDLTVDQLLEQMDAATVDRAVIAPVDRCLAVSNQTGNNTMLQAAGAHADRLIPSCSANPCTVSVPWQRWKGQLVMAPGWLFYIRLFRDFRQTMSWFGPYDLPHLCVHIQS